MTNPRIWLPPWYRELQQAVRQNGLLKLLTWSDVVGERTELHQLEQLAASCSAETLIEFASAGGVLYANRIRNPAANRDHQIGAVREMAPASQAVPAERLLKSGERDIFIHEEQLLYLARLAILHGGPGPKGPPDREVIGRLMLGVNDLLGREVDETPAQLGIHLSLRRLGALRNEQPRYLIGRYHDLLATRARAYAGPPPKLDLDTAYEAATGLTLDDYLGFALMYIQPFVNVHNLQSLLAADFRNVLQRYESQVADPTTARLAHELFSAGIDWFRSELEHSDGDPGVTPLLPFQQRPLVRLPGGSVLPLSYRLLMEKASTGAYWMLHEHFRQQSARGLESFTKFMGALHQEYVTDLLKRVYPAGGEARLSDELEVIALSPKRPKGQSPPFDAALLAGEDLVLFEMSTTAFTLGALQRGDVALFQTEVAKFTAKVRQLRRAVEGLADGAWDLPGLDRSRIRHILPVVVLLHPYPSFTSTVEPLEAELPAEVRPFGGTVAATAVHPVKILTNEELEMLEVPLASGDIRLPELLRSKVSDVLTRHVSMKTFLINHLRRQESDNPHMWTLLEVAQKAAAASLARHLTGFTTS